MELTHHLRLAGCALILLAGLNVIVPRHFGWHQEMQRVGLLARQVFFVHFAFIALTVGMFGVLSAVFTEALMGNGDLSRLVLGGMALFWAIRFFIQLFIYDRRLWQGQRGRTIAHVFFTLLWAYFAGVYAYAITCVA